MIKRIYQKPYRKQYTQTFILFEIETSIRTPAIPLLYSITWFSKVHITPLGLYKRSIVVPVFANLEKPKEDF